MRTGVRDSDSPRYDGRPQTSTSSAPARLGAAPIQALAHRLRASGLPVSTSELLDAVAATARVDITRRGQVAAALRATLVKDAAHDALFTRAFDAVFPRLPPPRAEHPDPARPRPATATADGLADLLAQALRDRDDDLLASLLDDAVTRFAGTAEGRSVEHHTQRTLRQLNLSQVYRQLLADRLDDRDESELQRAAAGPEVDAALARLREQAERLVAQRLAGPDRSDLAAQDLQDLPLLDAAPDEMVALRQVLRPLARRLASRLGARQRRGAGTLDMRRTIRRSMGTGGVPVTPALRRRHPVRPDLVLICDVSGSIAQYVPFALTLLHAVHREFNRVRSFVFVDGVVEVSDVLSTSPGILDPRQFLDRRGLVAKDGRSDYPAAFATFLRRYGDVVTARTTTVIIGDARSHDRPVALAQIRDLGYRSRRLYWLNPEPRREWDTTDSRQSAYSAHCTGTFEVASLRQLADAVAKIL